MNKPELLGISSQGHTLHSYDIEGGKTTYHHFLVCLDGVCSFYNTLEDAKRTLNFDINL